MQQNNGNRDKLPIGTVLRGAYTIESYIASGGFGNTYRATNQFGRTVAIKEFFFKDCSSREAYSNNVVVNPSKTQDVDSLRNKFRTEAQRMYKFNSEHLVRIHDLFDENQTAYYVMDYVDGTSLDSILKADGPMDEDVVWNLIEQVLDALRVVHAENIWHLDLKPANIMLDTQGVVKLIDFGASKQLNSEKGGATSTTGVAFTKGFAAREQQEGNFRMFGPWTDLYALGATAYKLLTNGSMPLPSDIDDDKTPDKHVALPLPQGVSEDMRQLVLWLMKTAPGDRPKSVEQVQEWMAAHGRGDGKTIYDPKPPKPKPQPKPQPQPTPKPVPPVPQPKGWLKWAAVAGGLAVVAALIVFLLVGKSGQTAGVYGGNSLPGAESVSQPALSNQTFNVNGVRFTMVGVQGGTFEMGATSEQEDPDGDEKPVHEVTLSSYYIGQTEVTQALWKAVMGSNPSSFTGDDRLPVENVSWGDCQEFISKLNEMLGSELDGREFRLPTEAEWEFAARGGRESSGYQYSGSNRLGDVAWYYDNSGSKTHPVAQKSPNELGIYDMSGNVWEWCWDYFGEYSSSAQTNPKGPGSGSYRVYRGGSWFVNAGRCRTAYRYGRTPAPASDNLGFRLAR